MLRLARKPGQSVTIGDAITITILETHRGKAIVGIDAPPDVEILRDDAKRRTPRPRPAKEAAA